MAGLCSNHPAAEISPSPTVKPPSPPLVRYTRCIFCPKCNVVCSPSTSHSVQNPNRSYYKCHPPSIHNKFFAWADEVKPDEFVDVPDCGGCGAGACRVRRERSGPNAGRILFMCRIKEGEGSCGYIVWQDELEQSATGRGEERINLPQSPTINGHANSELVKENEQINESSKSNNESPVTESSGRTQKTSAERVCNHTQPVNIDHFVEENNKSYEGANESSRRALILSDVRMTLFPSAMDNSDHIEPANVDFVEENKEGNEGADNELPLIDASKLECIGVVTSRKMDLLNGQENLPNELSSRRPHKRSRHGDLKGDDSTLGALAPSSLVSSQSLTVGIAAPSSLVSSQSLTVGPTMNSVLVEHCWMVAAIRENLSSQLQGWWGRLAFHPRPCLITNASKPLTFGVSSPQDKILVNSQDLSSLTKILLGSETYNKPLLNPCHNPQLSRIEPNDPSTETNIQHIMSKSISKAFGLAAEHLQNDFLALLGKMDITDHEAMTRASEATFAALDRLLFDHRDFKGRAEEYIHCARSLAEVEQSIPGDESYHKLTEHCLREKTKLDEMNLVHAKAVDSVNDSRKRLKLLQEEVSSKMDWLFQIEAELSCCEVEIMSMEGELEKMSRSKEDLEDRYLTAAKELEKSKELIERREAERNAAKAAFERAKESLRG